MAKGARTTEAGMEANCGQHDGEAEDAGSGKVGARKNRGRDGTTEQAIELIKEYGPMTSAELAAMLGKNGRTMAKLCKDQCKERPNRPQRLFIVRWIYDQDGQRKYPRPQYDIGTNRNKSKPKRDDNLTKREYRARLKKQAVNSVWALAMNSTQLMSHAREIRK